MNEKTLNRPILEEIAKDIMKLKTEEQIHTFVSNFVYMILLV